MLERVMVPVDSSAFAESALPLAVRLVRAANAQLHIVLVHQPLPLAEHGGVSGSDAFAPEYRQAEARYLDGLAERIEAEHGIRPRRTLLSGTPSEVLARHARRRDIDLIVMSTHGHGALNRLWLGSVADGVIRRSRVPVLLVRPVEGASSADISMHHVLAAVDGSAPAERALALAAELCVLLEAALTIIRVVVPPQHVITSRIPDTARMNREKTEQGSEEAERYLRELVARVGGLPQRTRTEVVVGTGVADAILRAAGTEAADVIALGTRGRGGAARLMLGSVADKVIRGSQLPVLVTPPER